MGCKAGSFPSNQNEYECPLFSFLLHRLECMWWWELLDESMICFGDMLSALMPSSVSFWTRLTRCSPEDSRIRYMCVVDHRKDIAGEDVDPRTKMTAKLYFVVK